MAFASHSGSPQRVGLGDVYVVPAGGGEPRQLAETPDRSANILGWSGDGRAVYVTEAIGTERHLIELPVDGGPYRVVTEGSGVFGSFSFDKLAQSFAFTYQESERPVDVHVSSLSRFDMKRVTDIHASVTRPTMGRTWRTSATA